MVHLFKRVGIICFSRVSSGFSALNGDCVCAQREVAASSGLCMHGRSDASGSFCFRRWWLCGWLVRVVVVDGREKSCAAGVSSASGATGHAVGLVSWCVHAQREVAASSVGFWPGRVGRLFVFAGGYAIAEGDVVAMKGSKTEDGAESRGNERLLYTIDGARELLGGLARSYLYELLARG